MTDVVRWRAEEAWLEDLPPFGFPLDGGDSAELPGSWRREVRAPGTAMAWADPSSGLVVPADVTRYGGFPAVEWVVRLRNAGSSDSPIVSDVMPLDLRLALPWQAECRVHHARGSECRRDDFAPLVDPLGPDDAGSIRALASR